jgi:hypothetical protein
MTKPPAIRLGASPRYWAGCPLPGHISRLPGFWCAAAGAPFCAPTQAPHCEHAASVRAGSTSMLVPSLDETEPPQSALSSQAGKAQTRRT